MIESFKHKGLKKFFETGSTVAINPQHSRRLKIILQLLNAAVVPEDMNMPGMRFHKLMGNLHCFYSVAVSANSRVIFQFNEGMVQHIDYVDYH